MAITNQEKCAQLLRRFGLGAPQSEIDSAVSRGYSETVEAMLAFEKAPNEIDDEEILTILKGDQNAIRPQMVTTWWIYRMLLTKHPMQEKLALFWHNHFATSGTKVQQGQLLLQQIQMFQRIGATNFHDLVLEVSRDPAMLLWLDGVTSVKGRPNENYARELLELFTMGIGNYTEQDIKEAARAFTGWSIRRATGSFFYRADQFDTGEKTFLGKTGNWKGEDIVRMAVEHPATAKFIARKFAHWFISDNPGQKVIDALAKTLVDSKYDVKALVRRIAHSEAFADQKNHRSIIKNPIDFVIGTARTIGMGERLRQNQLSDAAGQRVAIAYLRLVGNILRKMGMAPLYPPSVAGWDGGTAWISSGTMLERMRFADTVMGQAANRQRPLASQPPLYQLMSDANSLEEVVEKLQTGMDVKFGAETKTRMLGFLTEKGGLSGLTPRNPTAMNGLLKIVFASPEYQFA